jgi:hypothetical protein
MIVEVAASENPCELGKRAFNSPHRFAKRTMIRDYALEYFFPGGQTTSAKSASEHPQY